MLFLSFVLFHYYIQQILEYPVVAWESFFLSFFLSFFVVVFVFVFVVVVVVVVGGCF